MSSQYSEATQRDLESGAIPDKKYLYENFQNGEDWLRKFGRKLAYKSQDLADDDVEIQQNRIGMGWKELAVIFGGQAALASVALGVWALMSGGSEPTENPTPRELLDSEYEVRFFDANGNPIEVPHVSQRPQERSN